MSLNKQKQIITSQFDAIYEYLSKSETTTHLPLYSSMDIRVNHQKTTIVDTNLFPAGFNNLCTFSDNNISNIFNSIINNYIPNCKNILLLAENHTRNKFYLDNLVQLKHYLTSAGFKVDIAACFDQSNPLTTTSGKITLTSASNQQVSLYKFADLQDKLTNQDYDFILLNNDLIRGIPEELKKSTIPVYPSIAAGWHSRHKSHHFKEVNRIMAHCADQFNFDPFYVTTQFSEIKNCDINNKADQNRIYDQAKQLFETLETQYKAHNIDQKPFIFLKANSGSYGMGVVAIESPDDILQLNRKNRNRLAKGKESHIIDTLLLQEGIQSDLQINNQTAELCVYFASTHYLGGFYRLNTAKNTRSNLNSSGMSFQKIYTNPTNVSPTDPCKAANIADLKFYTFLGLVSVFAAHQETKILEKNTS